jgi:hypothetical protein
MMLPWSTSLDVAYVGQRSFNTLQNVNLNQVDYGAAYLSQNQDRTAVQSPTPGATAVSQDLMRPYRGYAAIQQQWGRGERTYHSLQLSFQRRFRNGFSFGFNDTISVYDRSNINPRLQHNPDGSFAIRADQEEAERLLGNNNTPKHILKGNFVWDLPDLRRQGLSRVLGLVVNDWLFSGIWSGGRFDSRDNPANDAYTVGYSYQNGGGNMNITGSPDFGGRILLIGDPGDGCTGDSLRQFNAFAFQGPPIGSVGLESSNNYLRHCFISTLDLAIARNITLGGGRQLQLRVDLFNSFNQAGITDRNTTMNLASPNDPVTITNLPFDPATGAVVDARARPRGAGFGVADEYQDPRRVQLQVRFSF